MPILFKVAKKLQKFLRTDDGGQSPTSPDSEQIEHTMPNGINAKLCEREANSRQIFATCFLFLCVMF